MCRWEVAKIGEVRNKFHGRWLDVCCADLANEGSRDNTQIDATVGVIVDDLQGRQVYKDRVSAVTF